MIGQSDYFGFGIRHKIENCTINNSINMFEFTIFRCQSNGFGLKDNKKKIRVSDYVI